MLDDLLAQGDETHKFNTEIERWLLALHKIQPLLLAARHQDGEAGGTRLGAWHAASLKMFPERVAPVFEALAKAKPALPKDSLRRTPVSIVVDYLGPKKVKPAIRALGRTRD